MLTNVRCYSRIRDRDEDPKNSDLFGTERGFFILFIHLNPGYN
jgi:hypothetical protein